MNGRRLGTPTCVSAWALLALLVFLPGCTDAVVDAAAAGGLSFIQQTVFSTLTDVVWGGADLPAPDLASTEDHAGGDGHG